MGKNIPRLLVKRENGNDRVGEEGGGGGVVVGDVNPFLLESPRSSVNSSTAEFPRTHCVGSNISDSARAMKWD